MSYLWILVGRLLPRGSRRRLFVKMMLKLIRHPIRFLKKTTPERIGKFIRSFRRDGAEGTIRRLEDSLVSIEIQSQKLKITQKTPGWDNKTVEDYPKFVLPEAERPEVSIVIPVYNQFDYTYHCLRAIWECSGKTCFEVILADDNSTDLTGRISEIVEGLIVIKNNENLRFLRNCNNAARNARGKYILFLNNDTQVQRNFLEPLVSLMESDKTIGIAGSKLVYPDGRLQEAGGIIWKDGSAWNYGNRSNPDDPEYNYVKEADYISGASLMIRRALWDQIGGFDERFAPAYYEDADLAFSVRSLGYKVVYQPLSVVVHFEGVSNGTSITSGQKAYQVINQKKFYDKWRKILETKHEEAGQNLFSARDGSIGKKTVVFIDHYVPQYDKDAGSKTVYAYLQLFVQQNFNVKFIGDNYYRHEPYTTALQQMGVEVLYGPYYAAHWKSWFRDNKNTIGYVFLNRPHISVKYIDFIRKITKARIVYYGHDLHFLREYRQYQLTGDKAKLRASRRWQKLEMSLMRKADRVYYPSPVEERHICRIDPSIPVKTIPAYLYPPTRLKDDDFNVRHDVLFVGGFGHSPNVDAVLWLAEQIMPAVNKLNSDIKIHIVGSNPPDVISRCAKEAMIIEGYVSEEKLVQLYSSCKLAVVPLRYGAGIKGKVIEAMHFGLPVVTTSVGAEGIDNTGKFLSVADEAGEIAGRISELYMDHMHLSEMRMKAHEYVNKYYTPESAIQVIGKDFDMR